MAKVTCYLPDALLARLKRERSLIPDGVNLSALLQDALTEELAHRENDRWLQEWLKVHPPTPGAVAYVRGISGALSGAWDDGKTVGP